jgi:phosphatidate cytidylyltransferase
MLRHRLIYGPIMIAVLVGLLYLDNLLDHVSIAGTVWQRLFLGRSYLPAGLAMFAAFVVLIPFGAAELCRIFEAKDIHPDRLMVSLAGITGCAIMYLMPSRFVAADPADAARVSQLDMIILATVLILLFLLTLVRYSWSQRTKGVVAAVGVTMFALIYMGLAPGFYLLVRRWHTAWIVAGIILTTKSCDIGAYVIGSAIGRHKLIPWLSPGKTWEGLIGGIACSTLAAMALGAVGNHLGWTGHYLRGGEIPDFHAQTYPLWGLALAGAIIGVIGQFGDLVASLFKRDAGLKDSGDSIPGFGGLLDVVDSPLIVAPLSFWLLELGRAAL